MSLSISQTATVRIVQNQAITNNLLRLLALSPSTSISGSVGNADLAAGAVTPAKTTPGAYFYGALSGTNSYAVTLNPAMTAYADGVEILGKIGNANTLSLVTLNVNGLGESPVFHRSGQSVLPGDLVANDVVRFRYNSSRDSGDGGWDVMEVLPSSGIRPAANVTTGTANAQAVVNVPPITAYAAGNLLLVKVGTSLTNTAALTLVADGLAARDVRRHDGSVLRSQDWTAGRTYLLYDDGTQFIVLAGITAAADTAVVASARNLIVETPQTGGLTTINIAADEVVLKTTDGRALLVSAVSNTCQITNGVALNGLETGAVETASTWYYIWLISDGTNVRSVLEDGSASLNGGGDGIAPAGPDLSNGAFAGYVYRALIGQVHNDGASDFFPFYQSGRDVWIGDSVVLAAAAVAVADTEEILAGGTLTAFRAAVPPTARSCSGFAGSDNTTDTVAIRLAGCQSTGALSARNRGLVVLTLPATGTAHYSLGTQAAFEIPVLGAAARNLQWSSRLTTLTVNLSVTGYTF